MITVFTVWILVLNLDGKHPINLEAFTTSRACSQRATELRVSYLQNKKTTVECQSVTVMK